MRNDSIINQALAHLLKWAPFEFPALGFHRHIRDQGDEHFHWEFDSQLVAYYGIMHSHQGRLRRP
jgi:hypothetical protein